MNKEDQVCTLEQAKKIASFGIELKTNSFWVTLYRHDSNKPQPGQEPTVKYWSLVNFERLHTLKNFYTNLEYYAAPNVAELGVLLPINRDMEGGWFESYRITDKKFEWQFIKNWSILKTGVGNTEAQARAEAFIWLIDNEFILVENLTLN